MYTPLIEIASPREVFPCLCSHRSAGCQVALFAVVGLSLGVVFGAVVGLLCGYWYVDPFWSRPPEGTSTVQGLRESIAAFTALVSAVVGAAVCGVVGCAIVGIGAWVRTRRPPS